MNSHGHSVEEAIRIQAYLLSEQAGHPKGMERHFWVQAEALLNQRAAALSKEKELPKKRPAKKTPTAKTEVKPAAVKPVTKAKQPVVASTSLKAEQEQLPLGKAPQKPAKPNVLKAAKSKAASPAKTEPVASTAKPKAVPLAKTEPIASAAKPKAARKPKK